MKFISLQHGNFEEGILWISGFRKHRNIRWKESLQFYDNADNRKYLIAISQYLEQSHLQQWRIIFYQRQCWGKYLTELRQGMTIKHVPTGNMLYTLAWSVWWEILAERYLHLRLTQTRRWMMYVTDHLKMEKSSSRDKVCPSQAL